MAEHRLFSIKTPVAGRAKRYLIDNSSVNVNAFDLITGYRADDSYFDYAESFLNNGISVEQLAQAMRLGKLRMENGEPACLAGKSGIEIAREIVAETKGQELQIEPEEYFPETNLKRIRSAYGVTQAELAKRSGVSLRSIQMYEQRNKNINKASADTMYSFAMVLGCTMEDLIER